MMMYCTQVGRVVCERKNRTHRSIHGLEVDLDPLDDFDLLAALLLSLGPSLLLLPPPSAMFVVVNSSIGSTLDSVSESSE